MRQCSSAIVAAAACLAVAVARPRRRPGRRSSILGKTITDVRVEIAGVPVADAGVLELVETRVGEPLAMRDVRGTIDHLVGLGRFEDVRVFASSPTRAWRCAGS